ncbi:hypothetical protein BCR39DRAFT_562921 [Naematelia encephala]|uniref:Uncharacterized protein n=1 Tax=Naematelia encephala TaxID=71784 RepID=A0A1Y2AD93_9TREE|nr:hypothetical protein BCR39DRAFT_562921 [Naematelia encephala]
MPLRHADEDELSRLFADLALTTSVDQEDETARDVESEEQAPTPDEGVSPDGPREVEVSTCEVLSASEEDSVIRSPNELVSACQDYSAAEQVPTPSQASHAILNGSTQAGDLELPISNPSTNDLNSSTLSLRQSRLEVSLNWMANVVVIDTQLSSKRFDLFEIRKDIRYQQHVIDDSEVTLALWNELNSTAARYYVSVLESRIKCARDRLGALNKDRTRLEWDVEFSESLAAILSAACHTGF